ncbi:MAG: hypothetical protein QXR48_03470 [Candidatus Woesearchaeota archaeon]
MMVRWLIAALFALLVVLSACSQQTIKAQPLNNTVPQLSDACATMQCGDNAYCEAGMCMCLGGFKECSGNCIPERSCCTNAECPFGRVCENGVCAERPVCGFNEEWDNVEKECICGEGTKFCSRQGKCIPKDNCCENIDCKGDQRCAVTTYSASVCIKTTTAKCSMIPEGTVGRFMTPIGDFSIKLENILEGPLFDLKVNNDTTRRLRPDEQSLVANGSAYVYVESMKTFGGYCREEPD